MTSLPVLLTMGDACGIGPEIIAKAFRGAAEVAARTVVLGDPDVMRRAALTVGGGVVIVEVDRLDAVSFAPGRVPVLRPPTLPAGLVSLPMGRVDALAGAAAAACIEHAVTCVRNGQGRAIVTAPVHKEALSAAGVPYPGHTEMLQALAADGGAVPPVRMMLANEQLRTVLVTIHTSLRKAIDAVTFEAVCQTIRIADQSIRAFGIPSPRIAVAGLNPHAGEGGLFGDEELRIIGPAIAAMRAEGIDASGPYAPDTVFMRARHAPPAHPGEFDVVIAMTHDHGLIPVKYLGVEEGVNVTLGLPFVRTSPDHGTAFDIAGTGRADEASLLAAWKMAMALSAA